MQRGGRAGEDIPREAGTLGLQEAQRHICQCSKEALMPRGHIRVNLLHGPGLVRDRLLQGLDVRGWWTLVS